jgi:predicted hydrocarbon binding protein
MSSTTLTTVKAPAPFEPIFLEAQQYVENYFRDRQEAPQLGEIRISGERYILVRASAMSVQFFEFMKNLYPVLSQSEAVEATSIVLFDIAHSIGKSDAKAFHQATNVTDPIAKLSTGPIHFAYTGWAFVEIREESRPSADENFLLVYDHPNSFEAESWLKKNGSTDFHTCFMNAGYSSGWCEESFGIPLRAREILCRSKGDSHCRFIMAQPQRLEECIEDYRRAHPDDL